MRGGSGVWNGTIAVFKTKKAKGKSKPRQSLGRASTPMGTPLEPIRSADIAKSIECHYRDMIGPTPDPPESGAWTLR